MKNVSWKKVNHPTMTKNNASQSIVHLPRNNSIIGHKQ